MERDGLRQDTSFLVNQIDRYNDIIDLKSSEIADLNIVLMNKNNEINVHKSSFDELANKYNKLQIKNKRLKQTSLVLSVVSCVLGIIVLIK